MLHVDGTSEVRVALSGGAATSASSEIYSATVTTSPSVEPSSRIHRVFEPSCESYSKKGLP